MVRAVLLTLLLATITFADLADFQSCHVNITREDRQRFGYAEDAYMNTTEIISKYEYPIEEHEVVTEDGYILTLFRIPHGRKRRKIGPPILLMHGMTDSPSTWIITGTKYGLGYQFADGGYDVWLGSYRGCRYTRRHKTLNPDTDSKYWKFSSEQMGQYDVPALMDYILEVTKRHTLSYLGHSLGCRMFFEMTAFAPKVYEKINLMMCVGPAVFLSHMKHPVLKMVLPYAHHIIDYADMMKMHELLGYTSSLTQHFQLLCAGKKFLKGSLRRELCVSIIFLALGDDYDELRDEVVPLIAGHIPDGVSLQGYKHLYQSIMSKKFRRFDYGADNYKIYGQPNPPEYDLSVVKTPVSIVVGKNDWLSSIPDAELLRNGLSNVVDFFVIPHNRWQHSDYMWARDAPQVVGERYLRLLKKYAK